MTELILAVSAVIIISALCSLFEAVLYSVPFSHIESLAQAGRTSGQILHRLRQRENVDRPISAILSLNTIANTGGAFIAGVAFIKVFGPEWEVYFTIGITCAVLFFSEVLPKTVGVVYNRSLSGFIARPLLALVWIFTPLVAVLRIFTRMISRGETDDATSPDELISMARAGHRAGVIEADEARVIQNILSLKSKSARDVMTPRTVVFGLSDQLSVDEAHEESGIWEHSRVPVYDKEFEDIVGIVIRRDALSARAEGRGNVKLSELMRPVHFVSESMTLDRILKIFLERRQHLFIVIDEFGGLAGILTLEDVLEEILGREIIDEFDQVTDMRELARRRRQQTLQE